MKLKITRPHDFAKNAAGIFSEIVGSIHFFNSIPALKGRAIDSFSIKSNYEIKATD
jgi:hypothetical protein